MPVLIAAACRSAFTRVDGALAAWHPVDLTAAIIEATLARAHRGERGVDEVWVGCAEPVGAQGADMARAAVLTAAIARTVGGQVIDRAGTSGTAALHNAVHALRADAIDAGVVVGTCSASTVPPGAGALGRAYGRPWGDGPAADAAGAGGLLPTPMAADHAAGAAGISRAAQDEWAARSHAHRRTDPAAIVTLGARPGEGGAIQRGAPVDADDRRARPTDIDTMPPSFDDQGTVTGFTFSPPCDGAAGMVLLRDGLLGDDGTLPRVLGTGRAAGDPVDPLGAVEHATARALAEADCSSVDIDRWEIVETTAAATLLAVSRLDIDPALVNPDGGTLAVGDAGAAEELRLLVDPIAAAPPGTTIAAVAFDPTGSAVTLIHCP